ncbi:MAG: M48 family metallopeptidase [Dolichospermum sp. JUN01]|jgi:Zn-dependent protease with chaperone function|uniref:M48 family metallopeptidase n=1 Tax=Aphanizomenon sp. UHCC 0183 TaxID=2590028 RepID=UPI0014484E87|nr:M48 family metallopeptidase [Aphanizomenon sp. UHCC 0183]MBO1058388.1 M48 family metallopeptidase [Dolichospermum sp. JUN01]MBS9395621.1 M48 family metallopeptidase [Dolichospermum sp. OL01]MCO5799247.1 M48 family metallopeptidase [Dolichospermum sp. OL03]MCS6281906.1 M48 family metallopeptidase [Dolichospermum sp.]QSV60613.1 MAG: M48 family metallopeptidase [Dolichospermum sp. LBC05a]
MTKKILTGLSSTAYEHPFDKKALASLQSMPGLSPLLKKVNEYGIDRLLRLQSIASEIRVTPRNFPQLYQPLLEACQILDVTTIPELYLFRGTGHIRTYIIGVEKPIVGINIEAMEWLNYDELLFIFGYEIARIKSQHMIYHQMSIVMPVLKIWISSTTLGLGGLIASGVELALYNWVMMAKFTADRAGLLACQDIDVATTALMKLAGLPEEYLTPHVIEDFLIQSREFAANSVDSLDQVTKILSYSDSNLSWLVMRTGELLKWVDSGEYNHVLQGENVNTSKGEEEGDEKEGWNFLTSW